MNEKDNIVKTLVKPEDILHVWAFAEKHLKKSAKRSDGRITLRDLLEECLSGESNLWIVYKKEEFPELMGCGITQITHYPTGLKMLNIDHVAGVKQQMWTREAIEILESFAKDCNCDGIEAIARAGFLSWIKEDDWNKKAVAFEKRFKNVLS